MKPKIFFAITLFFPYLCWIAAKFLAFPKALNTISGLYSSSIWIWGIPYTVLVISFLIWSRNKSIKKVFMIAFYSPLLLNILVAIEIFVAVIALQLFSILDDTQSLINTITATLFLATIFSLLAGIVIMPFGYIFVTIGLVIFKLLIRSKILEVDEEMPRISSMIFVPFHKIFKNISSA